MTFLRRIPYCCPQIFLHFRSATACVHSRVSFYSTGAALVNDVEKVKKPPAGFPLKKQAFTEEMQRSTFGKLVYRSPNQKTVHWCKLLSLSTSITTAIMAPYMVGRMIENEVGYTAPVAFSIMSSLFVFTPLVLDQLTKRLVLEMYYNSDSGVYTAVYLNVFLHKRALYFLLKDVKPANPATAFLYTHTVGKNLLLLARIGYKDEETCAAFESMLDRVDYDETKDDDDNDEPAKATTDHHKRHQDQ